jgi:cytochrome c553
MHRICGAPKLFGMVEMRKSFVLGLALAYVVFPSPSVVYAADAGPPPWAWGFTSREDRVIPVTPLAPLPGANSRSGEVVPPPHTLAGSKFSFTRAEVWSSYGPADWFPEDHPQMPEIVAKGRKSSNPPIVACALCHLTDGSGRPENANLTGLTQEYIIQQLIDFSKGRRKTSDPRKTNTEAMSKLAAALTDDDMRAAAEYFSAIPAKRTIKVIETATVPKTRSGGGTFHVLTGADAGTEPIGNRIVETPVNEEDSEIWRSPRSGFIAYVPPGSLKIGENLVMTGGGKTIECTACHGTDLRGLGPVPRLAGLPPSYIVRQLYDTKHGNRTGIWSPLMVPLLKDLSNDDMMYAAAYLASLDP